MGLTQSLSPLLCPQGVSEPQVRDEDCLGTAPLSPGEGGGDVFTPACKGGGFPSSDAKQLPAAPAQPSLPTDPSPESPPQDASPS